MFLGGQKLIEFNDRGNDGDVQACHVRSHRACRNASAALPCGSPLRRLLRNAAPSLPACKPHGRCLRWVYFDALSCDDACLVAPPFLHPHDRLGHMHRARINQDWVLDGSNSKPYLSVHTYIPYSSTISSLWRHIINLLLTGTETPAIPPRDSHAVSGSQGLRQRVTWAFRKHLARPDRHAEHPNSVLPNTGLISARQNSCSFSSHYIVRPVQRPPPRSVLLDAILFSRILRNPDWDCQLVSTRFTRLTSPAEYDRHPRPPKRSPRLATRAQSGAGTAAGKDSLAL